MANIILTTTPSFSNVVAESDLKDFLKERGIEVCLHNQLSPPFSFDASDVFGMVAGAAVPVREEALAQFSNLKVIMPFGVGTDHIEDTILKNGSLVRVWPGINKEAVAELTIAFIFALARNLVTSAETLRAGKWERLCGSDVSGKTLGIIGLGNIGKEVAKKASALGMRIVANDIVYDDSFLQSHNIEKADFETVLQTSDFLTLHVPLTEATQNFMNDKTFSLIKRGARFINTSRGAVVDEKALLRALESGRVAGAALDVLSLEPPSGDPFADSTLSRLLAHPRVIAIPHIGSHTSETHYRVARKICEEMAKTM